MIVRLVQYAIARTGEDASVQVALIALVIVEQAPRAAESEFAMTSASEETIAAKRLGRRFGIRIVAIRQVVAVDHWWH